VPARRSRSFRVPPSFDPLDHLLALDPGRRGIADLFTPGAAAAAARALAGSRRALITTGFVVQEAMAETDGPPGAAVLGHALRALGGHVAYVSDAITRPVLAAALEVLDEPATIIEWPPAAPAADRASAARTAAGVADALLRRERPTHLVSIERPGRTVSGDYLTMRGDSVAAWNAPVDALFLSTAARPGARHRAPGAGTIGGRRPRPITVGIGDGGNEIGMGNARSRLVRRHSPLARVASVVRVDHLVVAGTSNWGAYGIVAALSRLAGRPLLHTPATERRLVEACVKAGAADGVSRQRQPTVDGLSLDVHAAVVELLGYHWSTR
jgi:D-glutamate cyclase